MGGTTIVNKSSLIFLKKLLRGQDNSIEIGEGGSGRLFVRIIGNGNKLIIGSKCVFGHNCSIWIEGNNSTVRIGDNTTMTLACHLCCQENGRTIEIGDDCMFSNNLIIRTSDAHPIYDIETNQRLNPGKDVKIGNHVWIAPNTKIMKGANIEDGVIVGSDTTVNKTVKANCLVVGRPARVVKENVKWTREALW